MSKIDVFLDGIVCQIICRQGILGIVVNSLDFRWHRPECAFQGSRGIFFQSESSWIVYGRC